MDHFVVRGISAADAADNLHRELLMHDEKRFQMSLDRQAPIIEKRLPRTTNFGPSPRLNLAASPSTPPALARTGKAYENWWHHARLGRLPQACTTGQNGTLTCSDGACTTPVDPTGPRKLLSSWHPRACRALYTKALWEAPFSSRRNIALTMLAGSAGLWLLNNTLLPACLHIHWATRRLAHAAETGPIQFADKPNVPFKLLGFTDLSEDQFVYFRTPGGNWVAAAEDQQGRLFMVDEIGDLYYDSGDRDVGLYAMDTQGNLFNFYTDEDRQRKITPVGNVSDLQSFKISELAGVKLDREVNVVAFTDGRQVPLPPGTGYIDENGKFIPPGELVEGYTVKGEESSNVFMDLFQSRKRRPDPKLDRVEVDLEDPTPFQRQMFDQVLFTDPDSGLPYLPDDFDLEEFEEEVRREVEAGGSSTAGSSKESIRALLGDRKAPPKRE
ncbi:hypothetical protein QJQ45_006504 [Haematococcus lacustris]|nr:hypothetical protein QJQ45_006504 [Haematococcus lacustris]